ncbi:carbonic anhydrase [Rickettsiales bacterium LUAb2]
MLKNLTILSLAILLLLSNTYKVNADSWNYSDVKDWDHINSICSKGKKQSPININKVRKAKFSEKINYNNLKIKNIINNGHTIQINFEKGNTLIYKGKTYNLLQVHFHVPSEHTLNGQHFSMEAHFVNQAKDGSLAVIGVWFKYGKDNKTFANIIKEAPKTSGSNAYTGYFNINNLLPKSNDFYSYIGSLTTPPCSENVNWIVMEKPMRASMNQINQFKQILHGNTNRPVQKINHRIINLND